MDSSNFEDFLANKLKFSNWKETFAKSKLKCLEEVLNVFGQHVNFQNINWSITAFAERKIPTEEEAIDFVFKKGVGGCCIHNNYAFKILLDFLGYDSFFVAVHNPMWFQVLHSHVIVIVRLEGEQGEEEMYAIDVGFSRRIPYLIPLHKLPFREKVGGWEFEFRKNEETGNYERIFHEGCPGYGKFKDSEGGKRLDYYFDLTPRSFNYFDPPMTQIFVDPESRFMMYPFINRLIRIENSRDYEYVAVLKKAFVIGTRDQSQRTIFESYQEMEEIIQKYFPNLDKLELKTALDKFDDYERQNKV